MLRESARSSPGAAFHSAWHRLLRRTFRDPPETTPELAPNTAAISELTAREQEVFLLMAHGDTNADIAEELFISEGTVKTHVKRVFSKLEMRDRAQLVVFAYEQRLVVPNAGAADAINQSAPRIATGG